MTKKTKHAISRFRYYTLLGLILAALIVVVLRIFHLQLNESEFLNSEGQARITRIIKNVATRGIITDRNNQPLAVTTTVEAIWANPKIFLAEASTQKIEALADLLNISPERLTKKMRQDAEKHFTYLARQISPAIGEKISQLKIPGIFNQKAYQRFYPTGEVSAQLVGFTDIDDNGQEGLELSFNSWLKGRAGSERVLKDRLGQVIKKVETIKEPHPGGQLSLSIDKRLQYLAYRELKKTVSSHQAVGGSAVILDIDTGEVLAMVNQPSFNPNNRAEIKSHRVRNRSVTDLFEPGSVIKAFSMATVLESGKYYPETVINTQPGWLRIGENIVRDIRNFGSLDLTGILRKSSNVGISKVITSLEPNSLPRFLTRIGFGQPTGGQFPGEQIGRITLPHPNDRFSQSTQAFGYGISVTALQLAQAYATLGSGGIRRPVSFLKLEPEQIPAGDPVMAKKTADAVIQMLTAVINTGGSGTRARVPGYKVSGKTGTSRKAGPEGYKEIKYQSVFAGLVPASQPKLAMVVMVDEPRKGGYYGGLVAAPVFADVMAGAVRLLDIKPDDLEKSRVIVAAKYD